MEFTRNELLMMATAYHGKVYTTAQFAAMSDSRLASMCHPDDVGRVATF